MTITIHFTNNADLNSLLTLADRAYTAGDMANFDSAMDLIDRHFYGLSIIPQC